MPAGKVQPDGKERGKVAMTRPYASAQRPVRRGLGYVEKKAANSADG